MNEHPLSQNFHDLSDDELDRKYNELTRRWHLAKRMQMDEYVLHQLDIMLNSIENEKWNRLAIPETDTNIVLETDPLPKTDGNKS